MLSQEKFSTKLYEKAVKYLKKMFLASKKVFIYKRNIKILFEIISIGRLLVLYINFHADLISKYVVPSEYPS